MKPAPLLASSTAGQGESGTICAHLADKTQQQQNTKGEGFPYIRILLCVTGAMYITSTNNKQIHKLLKLSPPHCEKIPPPIGLVHMARTWCYKRLYYQSIT